MKKFFVGLLAVVMAVTGAVMLASCGDAQSAVRKDGAVYNSAPTKITTDAYNNAEVGINFKSDRYDTYETSKALGANLPRTMQATFTISSNYAARAGIIVGNHRKTIDNAWNFEIQWNGTKKIHYPKLYYMSDKATGSGNQIFFNFEEVKLTAGKEYFVTIVHDTYNKKATCYAYDLTGALQEQTLTTTDADYSELYVDEDGEFIVNLERPTRIGGDYRNLGNTSTENNCNFKGTIKNVSLFSDLRTKKEVESDWKRNDRVWLHDESLIAAYDFTQTGDKICNDLSGNGYNLVATKNDFAKNMDGMAFGRSDSYILDDKLPEIPNTYEAYLYLPENYTPRSGIIFGNYKNGSSNCFSFEIHANGMPKLYYDYGSYNVTNVNFEGANVALGRWVHVAIVHDTVAKTATLYLDGEQEMVLENVTPPAEALSDPAYSNFEFETDYAPRLGGDYRDPGKDIVNATYFRGLLHSVAVYSDVRTQAEIKADMTAVDTSDEGLLAYYELAGQDVRKTIMDLSGNGYNIGDWLDAEDIDETGDYDYSFAVIGDTQIVSERYSDKMDDIYKWVVDNASAEKIAHVFGLGDITNSSTDAEWTNAKKAISQMDGKVAYSLVRGNHDGSAKINSTFGYEAYTKQFAGFYEEGKIENSYKTFTAGGVDYLLITLDYGASDEVLAWAGELCDAYPDHKVIVTTHAYLYRDGTTLDQGDVCPPATTGGSNNGDHIWDKFVSKYGNIFLVLSGHDPCEKLVTTQTKGIHGNTVTQMLIDPQGFDVTEGGTGMIAMLYFKGDEVTVRWYSPVREAYYKASNQYGVTIPEHEFDAHTYEERPVEANLVTPATETSHAVYIKSCVCGKVSEATDTFEYCNGNHLFDRRVSTDEFLAKSRADGSHAKYYYSCICGEKGEETYEVCDEVNHVYKEKVSTSEFLVAPATETSHAVYYYSCLCGAKGEETYEQCNGNHVFIEKPDAAYLASAANCMEKATYYKSCICGEVSDEVFEYGEVTDDHVYDRKVVGTATFVSPATCTLKPTYYYSCVCGEIGEETFTYGKALGHTYDEEVAEEQYLATEATCQAPATYFYSCECGASGDAVFAYGEVDANAHVYNKKVSEEYVATEATCQAPATYYLSCVCGEVSEDTFTYGKVAPHEYELEVAENEYLAKEATCASPALYYYSCKCGATGSKTFASGNVSDVHEYNLEVAENEYLATEATCQAPATYYYSCACGETGEETFAYGSASGAHNYDKEVATEEYLAKDATCAKKATYYYSCECGVKSAKTFEYGDYKEHDYYLRSATDKYLATEATCTEKATYYLSCECGARGEATFESGITAPHVYNKEVATDKYLATEATCTEKATYYLSCECGAKGYDTFASGEVTAHVYDNLVSAKVYLASEATCQAPATYYYSCKCGAKGETTFENGKALGHSYNTNHDCLDKTCVRCDYVSKATASHEYDGGRITKPATVNAEGVKTYTCTKCKTTKTESVDKLEDGASCATVAPVSGGFGGGGTALMIVSMFAVALVLNLKKRKSAK